VKSDTPPSGYGPALGPDTGDTLRALGVLEETAGRQAEPAVTAVLSVYTGPVTGDQLGLLEYERAEPAPGGRGRHARAIPRRLRARLASFSVIGAVVLGTGIIVQAALVRAGAGFYGSYAGQAVISIELSWLLNNAFTWDDRGVPALRSWWRFTVQKTLLTIPNVALYAGAGRLGAGWLAANLATTVVFTIVNYVTGDRWSFSPRIATLPPAPVRAVLRYPLPSVSVVIPCKSNEKTILATVESLLAQDYPELAEVICVGDVGDPTWGALAWVTDPRLILLEQEKTPGRRDPNVKRDKGVRKSTGDVIALSDSDIVMDPDWLSKSVALLQEQGGGLVGGGMRAIRPHKFWPRFVDRNALAAKTSRIPRPYSVTSENFGARGRKPPITANAVITRDAYEDCPLDVTWAYGYEDYEWMHRLAADGHRITMSPDLAGAHHHREKFSHLLREYRRSAHGCAQFIRRHPASRLARKRKAQALGLPVLALAAVAVAVAAVAVGAGGVVAALAFGSLAALAGREALRSRSAEGAAYPVAALALAGVFTFTLAAELLAPGSDRDAPVWDAAARPPRPQPWRSARPWVIGAILAAGLIARLWDVGAAPEWQLDEITYASIAENLVRHGTLNVPLAFGQPFQPFLYHPPFYPYELAAWFRVAGQGITQARVLGALSVTVAFGLLARLLGRLYGQGAAAFATLLIMFDGWMLYVGRISYIENSVLVIMMCALLAYRRAAASGRMRDYVLAGLLTGAAGAFNYDAAYLLVVLAVHWLMVRRDSRQHAAALGCAVLVMAADALALMRLYTVNGTDWWLHDTLVQVARLTGGQSSAGTITGPGQFLDLLARQYDLFLPSVLAAAAALGLLGWRLIRCARQRRLAPLGPDLLLPAWCIAAVCVFGPASLHFSQYFVMVLLPLYSYLWVSLWPVLRRARWQPAAAVFAVVVVALGCGSAVLRLRQDANAFRDFQQYAATRIPPGDLVVAGTAGDPIAYVISQPWCSPGTDLSAYCSAHASYVVTWQTFLQPPNPLRLRSLQALLGESRPVARFTQFSGTIVVWKVDR
jgi:4-amino-4-deoxy-L-arabinose transferase-like glycosyltransferase/putative flippase GtrA/GT2 family glycosyltransferase